MSHALAAGGEMGALVRSIDWAKTPLGPMETWPSSLRTMAVAVLQSRFPMLLWWGREMISIYNDAYRPLLGEKHPRAMGASAAAVWQENWHVLGSPAQSVLDGGPATWNERLPLFMNRRGFVEESYWTFSYSPAPDDSGGVGGVLCAVQETTEQVQSERQLQMLRELGGQRLEAKTAEDACRTAAAILAKNDADFPFALIYLLEKSGVTAKLVATAGMDADEAGVKVQTVDLKSASAAWPLRAADTGELVIVSNLSQRFGVMPGGRWGAPPEQAVIVALTRGGQAQPYGYLVAGASPMRGLDDRYERLFRLTSEQLVAAVGAARAFEEERALRWQPGAPASEPIETGQLDGAPNLGVFGEAREAQVEETWAVIERTRAEAALRESEAHLATELADASVLQKVSNELVSEGGAKEHFNHIVEVARTLMRSNAASVQALDAAGSRLKLLAHVGFHPESAEFWAYVDANVGSPCGRALAAQKRVVVPDIDKFEAGPHEMAAFRKSGIMSVQSTPLVASSGRIVGMLSTHWNHPHAPSVDDYRFFDILARLAADFIERARAEAALRLSEARLIAAFASVPVGIGVFGTDGKAVLTNAEADRFVANGMVPSRDPERVRRWQAWDADGRLIPPHDYPGARALRGERVIPGLEMLYTGDASRAIWTNVASAPIFDGAGQVTGCILVISDITDRKTAVTELREANRAKDEFLAMLGHELRNPLAPIVSTLELMRMDGGRKFEKEREMMLRQARHLAALLDDLLDVARLARGKIELHRSTVALDELVARAVEAAGPLIEQRQHELRVDVAPGLLLDADEKRIVQVISNLLNNAARYTPRGGHIFVSGERDEDRVVLRVRDDGTGIAPELLPHVFDRFQQGPSAAGGSEPGLGVGLAMVRSLVELHGGTVTAASEGRGKGSELTVRLPARAQRASAPPPAADASPTPARAAGHRILLVDDNGNITDVLAVLLTKSGNIVEKAYDALSALSVASTFQPTVAILDIGLPDMSGYELAKRLRKRKGLANTKLIALTGYGGSADRQRSKRAGFAEHLPKPVELEVLLASIDRISAPLPTKTSRARNATRANPSKSRPSRVAAPPTTKTRPRSRKKRRR